MTTAKCTMSTWEQQHLHYPASRFNEKGCFFSGVGWRCPYMGTPNHWNNQPRRAVGQHRPTIYLHVNSKYFDGHHWNTVVPWRLWHKLNYFEIFFPKKILSLLCRIIQNLYSDSNPNYFQCSTSSWTVQPRKQLKIAHMMQGTNSLNS
jgi:hypothetical protein